jgi:hypothetical protein
MASAAQIAANRANAARSTGPRTVEGKARVAYIRDSERGNTIARLDRYQTSLERSYYRALHDLERRLSNPESSAMSEPPRGASALSPKIGFGSQNDFCSESLSRALAEENKRETAVSPLRKLALGVSPAGLTKRWVTAG